MAEYVPGQISDSLPFSLQRQIHSGGEKHGVDDRAPSTSRGLEAFATYQRRVKERGEYVFKGEGYPDLLGFKNAQELLEYVKNKTVLDLGAGFGQLRRDIVEKHPDFPVNIVSVEPRLAKKEFRELANPDGVAAQTTDKVGGGSVAASWSHLPFADESFDAIFSVFAFPYWAKDLHWGEVRQVCDEILRITKNGGEIRLAPYSGSNLLMQYLEKNKKCDLQMLTTSATVDTPLCLVIKKIQ